MGSLSRVQLAAALIEYDNDDPYVPEFARKFAQHSAIMSSMRSPVTRPKSQASARRGTTSSQGHGQPSTKPVRRDWTREREMEAAEEEERLRASQPSPVVQDFRRSASPFLQDVRPATPPPPAEGVQAQPSASPPATPRQVTVSQPTLVTPKVRNSKRNTSISGVLAVMMDTPSVFEGQQAAPPKAHVPPRPHSTQPLNSTSLLESIPVGDPLARPPRIRSGASASGSAMSSPTGWAPAPVALFNVPSFDDLTGIPFASSSSRPTAPARSTTKRRLSALLMSKPKVAPPPVLEPGAEPIRPLSETLRQSIASLPRSLGGEGPTARSFGQRGRTASMGDWESLVLAHSAGDEVGEMGQYAQRVRGMQQQPSAAQPQEQAAGSGSVAQDDDGTIEYEGVYGARRQPEPVPSQPDAEAEEQRTEESTPRKKPAAAVVVHEPADLEQPTEQLNNEEESRRNSSAAQTPESSWDQLSRPSSGYSFIDRVPLDDGSGDLDLPPMFRNDHSGTNTPRSTAGDYNDRAIPFPASHSRPLSPTTPSTPFRGLDIELGERDDDRHGPEGGRHTPGGTSLFDEIGRMTPDLLARNEHGEVDRRPSMEAAPRGGPSRMSQATRGSRYDQDYEEALADSDEEMLEEEERWVPPPTKGRASRFDPKSQSISSRMTPVPPGFSDDEDGTDSHRRTSEDATGRRLPGKRGLTKPRPTSLAHFGQTHRLSTTPTSSIFLPPVLVMPAPLDPNGANTPLSRSSSRQGFMTTDSKPLPASFTSRPPMVHSKSSSSFVAAAASLGVPQKRLSLAQKTFRASLVVDGRRGKEFMGGALEEGERGWELDEDAGLESVIGGIGGRGEDDYRGPGSLYGRSLMEVLEERKAALKSKQRVFTGDARPAMFTRTKSSNSIGQVSQRPGSTHLNPTLPGSRGSYIEPDGENPARPNTLLNPTGADLERPGMGKKRSSVFGIDQLWEKETREREEEERGERERAEKRDEAERLAIAAEEERKRLKHEKKQAGKRKSRMSIFGTSPRSNPMPDLPPMSPNTLAAVETPLPTSPGGNKDVSRIPTLPPTLSLLEHSPSAEMAEILHGDSDSDWEARDAERGGDDLGLAKRRKDKGKGKAPRRSGDSAGLGIGTWFASSDEDEGDDDDAPRRRSNAKSRKSVASTIIKVASESTSSDDEVPLAAQYNLPPSHKGASSFISITKPPKSDSDSEEELPLAQILASRGQSSLRAPTIRSTHTVPNPTTTTGVADEDEDDVPLGLRRASSLHQPPAGGAQDDDDLPLGMTQAQHLQQVYMQQQQEMAFMHHQQQQQQQQMMMMGMGMGGYGGMGMNGMGMMGMGGMQQLQMLMGGPPPGAKAEEKVDRWRRGVAGES